MMLRKISLLALLLASGLLGGCASDKPEDPNHVSSMPWNRPEKWESSGPMGGFTPNSQ